MARQPVHPVFSPGRRDSSLTFYILSFSPPAVSRLASGAAVDRYDSDRQQHTSVINFRDTTKDRRIEEESQVGVGATTVESGQEGEEDDDDEYYYYEEDYEDGMSGDYDLEQPRGEDVSLFFVRFQFLQTSFCNLYVFFLFSCHVKQT